MLLFLCAALQGNVMQLFMAQHAEQANTCVLVLAKTPAQSHPHTHSLLCVDVVDRNGVHHQFLTLWLHVPVLVRGMAGQRTTRTEADTQLGGVAVPQLLIVLLLLLLRLAHACCAHTMRTCIALLLVMGSLLSTEA